jgi:hypothetical protein
MSMQLCCCFCSGESGKTIIVDKMSILYLAVVIFECGVGVTVWGLDFL